MGEILPGIYYCVLMFKKYIFKADVDKKMVKFIHFNNFFN